MKIRLNFSIKIVFLLLFGLTFNTNSQTSASRLPTTQIKDAKAAVAKLREFYNTRDFESGYESGKKLTAQFPDNLELQAWFIVNMAQNEMRKDAVEEAKKLVENNKENAWAWFALANAYISNSQIKEAVPAAAKALELESKNEDFIFLYASSLLSQKKYDEIYAWLDKNSSKIKDRSRLLIQKAEAQYRQSDGKKIDEAKRKLSFETFARARKLNPNSVNANYTYGLYLTYDKRFAESLPLVKKAAALSPQVTHIRYLYWKAIFNGQPDKSKEQRRAEVIADMNNLMRLRPDSAIVLAAVSLSYQYILEMPDKSGELDTVIIKKFPQTAQAELALINKIARAAGIFYKEEKDKKVDEQNRSQFGIMLKDFIKRPKHYEDLYLADAYRYLYEYTRVDKKVSDAEFLQSARQYAEAASNSYPLSVAYTHSIIAEGLAERKMFREAEKFVNIGFEKVNKLIERQRENIKDEKRLEKQANEMNSALHSALGWTYFKENRLDEAEKEIEKAIKLAKENSRLYNRLGEIYEAKNVLDKAEDAYLKAFLTFIGKENPNVEVLKSLYRKRHNTLEGFETYFEKVKETERAMRKSLPPFTLKDVEGKSLSSADLKGKIVVINAWATWCVPCVKELPEFQELHKKYLGDKDVAILTINDGEDSAVVKKFMIDKKFDFAVLLDEKYLRSINDDILPTTWFIDRTGKISFTQLGYQGKILEEFVRRIEEMKK